MNFSNIMIPGPLQAEHVTSTCQLGSASSLSPPLPLSQLHGPESNCAAQPRARSGIHVTRSRRGLAALDPAVSICGFPPVAGAVRPPVLTFIIKAGHNVGQQLLRAYYCLDRQGHTGKSSSVLVNSDKICGCALSRNVMMVDVGLASKFTPPHLLLNSNRSSNPHHWPTLVRKGE